MFIRPLQNTCKFLYSTQLIKTPKNMPEVCWFSQKTSFAKNQPQMIIDPETGEQKKKKSAIIPKITVLSGPEITVTTLEEAQKLAKRRDLKLVKIIDLDTKTHRPVYKLMTGAEYHEEDLKQREKRKEERQKSAFKGEKVLIVNPNISEHDLRIHLNKIMKWLAKQYEVRMVINGSADNKKAEDIYLFLESNIGQNGRILQKRQKGTDIKFQVLPPKGSGPQ